MSSYLCEIIRSFIKKILCKFYFIENDDKKYKWQFSLTPLTFSEKYYNIM